MSYFTLRAMLLEQFARLMLWLCPRVAAWCERNGRLRVIDDHYDPTVPYLRRHYILFQDRRWKWQAINVVLHHFLRGDHDDALHSHPWAWATLILTGGYWEHTPKGRFWRGPGTIVFRLPGCCHRVELDPNAGPVYTLFWMGPKWCKWGFCNPEQTWWIEEHDYLTGNISDLQGALARKPKFKERPAR